MPVDHPIYPVNLVVDGRPCLVVGGGTVARHKVRGLVEAGAKVTVVAPDLDPGIAELSSQGVVTEARPYRRGEAADYRLVVAATGDPVVNQQVYDDAEAAGVWINSADDPERCTAILPARLDRGRLTVTVSTAGHSPAVASWLRDRLADQLGPEYDALIGLLSEERRRVRDQGRSTEGLDWRSVLDSGILEDVRAGRLEVARERLRACLSSSSD
ncbi:MAG TPA: bifunctional precorrin-2 dehydrogenase/sirohydrochlorin ferrochelatase [Acidimicrobiales bacterium]|jgi:siroheme synthase-like protein|nr:bifunctional precorrin-2 dehydrogenase/sirohydrochlorin ferrochelatase [Acidimicrobiales bacterium]